MKLENSKIIFLGDSITQGALASDASNAYHQIIKKEYNLAVAYNGGIGGTRIAKQIGTSEHIFDLYYALRVDILPTDADAVVVFGGTNDYGHGNAKLGEEDSNDICTFNGALNILIKRLKEKYKNSKIIFMTPLKRVSDTNPNAQGYILKDYVDAIIKAANKHYLPLIDLYNCGVFDPYDTETFPDGLHPGDKGHKMLADFVAKELIKL